MSYCVHCGVELAKDEIKCPLCDTKVLDPNKRDNKEDISSFPERMDVPIRTINTRFLASLVGLILVFPLSTVVIIDLLTAHNLTWSLYVLGAELCLWVFIALPIAIPVKRPYLFITLDVAATAVYLLLIDFATKGTVWYSSLGLPLVIAVGLTILGFTFVCRRKSINKIGKGGWLIVLSSLFIIVIDLFVYHYVTGIYNLSWSWYVSFPMLVGGIVLIVISRSGRICQWIRKKMFI